MRVKKINMQPSRLVALWYVLLFTATVTIMILLTLLTEVFTLKRLPGLGGSLFEIAILSIFVTSWILWRKATFTRNNFTTLARAHGVYLLKKRPRLALHIYSVYLFAHGVWDDIRVAAVIVSPFFSYWPGQTLIGFDMPARQEVQTGLKEQREERTLWEKTQDYILNLALFS